VNGQAVARAWFAGFAEVVPRGTALLAHDTAGGLKQEPSELVSASEPLRRVRVSWGANEVKAVARVPLDEYAPPQGELSSALCVNSRGKKPTRSAMRGRPPQVFAPTGLLRMSTRSSIRIC
jgi:hypothetical protein